MKRAKGKETVAANASYVGQSLTRTGATIDQPSGQVMAPTPEDYMVEWHC